MPEEIRSIDPARNISTNDEVEATSRNLASALGVSFDDAANELYRSAVALHATPSEELCERLRTALELAASRNAESMEALRLAVCSFTVALRDEARTPEAVLISLKGVIHNRSLQVFAPEASDWSGYQLRSMMTTWCIKEYFRETTA